MRWQELPNAPPPGKVVAHRDGIPDGGACFWTAGDGKDTFRLLILRSGDEVFGYLNRCAHFGVPLAQKVEQLVFKSHLSISCNVHYARYGWRDGTCLLGDCAGEGLVPVPLAVENGEVRIAG